MFSLAAAYNKDNMVVSPNTEFKQLRDSCLGGRGETKHLMGCEISWIGTLRECKIWFLPPTLSPVLFPFLYKFCFPWPCCEPHLWCRWVANRHTDGSQTPWWEPSLHVTSRTPFQRVWEARMPSQVFFSVSGMKVVSEHGRPGVPMKATEWGGCPILGCVGFLLCLAYPFLLQRPPEPAIWLLKLRERWKSCLNEWPKPSVSGA